jgi:hypothetical protein
MGATFEGSDELRGARFRRVDLSGADFRGVDLIDARFHGVDLSGAVLRGVYASTVDLDGPWLFEGATVVVNGVDVMPFVDAELDRRHPGRALRHATDPAGLRAAWAALESTWAETVARVGALPAGSADASVDGEWSFAQTLRHLVMATDTWLGRAVLRRDQPYHPLGLPDTGSARSEHLDPSVFSPDTPTWAEVLAARADRVAMVRDFLATVTPAALAEPRSSPWAPSHQETVLSCLHTIMDEEWEHHRYATRDLTALG